ncbi:class I SAM-dependent methyltransferase [Halovulum dunhuangense]|uniref:Class I SAM-dependent methyltransferase n=1 Tax=Halovulum dunhuangense TaxID=1505036 RepID=A0A849L181_9RHOB|nr:class I SAM-dependent methyltransferase [Halovulum dunhuangense]NNU80005.1 class I SAM-dependent methyltransferase [Halovulum dunhuangense]
MDLRAVYDRQANAWDAARAGSRMEEGWLSRVTRGLCPGAAVLDIGCGSGVPVAAWLAARGFSITGVDFSSAMIGLARKRLPQASWIEADMRSLDLGRRYAAVIAWDSFFHLSAPDQRAMIPIFAAHLSPGGRLLFTSGPDAGQAIGTVGGEPVCHSSLSPEEYRAQLAANGLRVLAFRPEDPDCGGHSVWLAEAESTRGQAAGRARA